tara:strand:+ start:280 stop:423 length:144 start_codon:yes stop_codon:yes gene_type:complete
MKLNNKVIESLQYFHGGGYIENLHGDERYYTEILMEFASKKLNIELT